MTAPRKPGVISEIAWLYIALGAACVAASLAGARIQNITLQPADAWLPGLLLLAGIGALLRKPWGRWLSYLFSVWLLLGVPIGTIVGGLMIYHLTIYRDQFRRPRQTKVTE